uniref:Vitellogenin domain-containing protein n=1 Tax=Clastoptera arizonana TaxID=38151 RepID=A0A1B6CB32_9HEMI
MFVPSVALMMVWWSLCCYGFVLLSSTAAAGSSMIFEPGTGGEYDLESTLLLNEPPGATQGKDVGFQVSARLRLESVWENPENHKEKLLRLELRSPQLHIKSRKAPAPEGFVVHTSKLDNMKNSPFLLHWLDGEIKNIYLDNAEEVSLSNLKRGISSLFQFSLIDKAHQSELDASGLCSVSYKHFGANKIMKIKHECKQDTDLPHKFHYDKIWGANILSNRVSEIILSEDSSTIKSISSKETHELHLEVREEAGGCVKGHQKINLAEKLNNSPIIKENHLNKVIDQLEKSMNQKFEKQSLITHKETTTCQDGSCPKLYNLVKENRENLQNENVGSIRSASSFIKLLPSVRTATKEEITKILKQKKNKDILPQIYDLLGAAQTIHTHQAATNHLKLDYDDFLDLNERYFWSLSFGSHPRPEIIADIIKIITKQPRNEKLFETLLLTMAAITNKLKKFEKYSDHKVIQEAQNILDEGIKECSENDDDCKLMYFRAYKNLGMENTIPQLLTYSLRGTRKVNVAAIKTIRSFPKAFWKEPVLKAAEKIYYQIGKRYDSSARTLAVDILLESNPSYEVIRNLLMSLKTPDPSFEVKQYLLQRLYQVKEKNCALSSKMETIIKSESLNNYNTLGQRGLSTAFTRSFLEHPSLNGSLSTIQEISSGIVKRGIVDIIVEKDNITNNVFTLGLFAGGLGSFVSSDENATPSEEPEEVATAGMDLTVLGVQIRPFVFFSGQGELMGHVWSGTASEKTPAFQTLALLQDYLEYVRLELGYIAEFSLLGGVSFDLSGQVTLSLWNRNAESLVEKNAGVFSSGHIKVNSIFVHSQIQFSIATEVKLSLVSNIDFYNTIALCMQLQQPNSVVKHNVHKVERIPGSKHRLRKSKYKTIPVAGSTYALNRKNNEMCNIIFKS